VRFFCAFGDKVVNEYANIGFRSFKDKFLFPLYFAGSINSSYEPLAGSFFISSSTINLTCKEEAVCDLCFHAAPDLIRREVIILNGIAGAQHYCLLEPRNGLQGFI